MIADRDKAQHVTNRVLTIIFVGASGASGITTVCNTAGSSSSNFAVTHSLYVLTRKMQQLLLMPVQLQGPLSTLAMKQAVTYSNKVLKAPRWLRYRLVVKTAADTADTAALMLQRCNTVAARHCLGPVG